MAMIFGVWLLWDKIGAKTSSEETAVPSVMIERTLDPLLANRGSVSAESENADRHGFADAIARAFEGHLT